MDGAEFVEMTTAGELGRTADVLERIAAALEKLGSAGMNLADLQEIGRNLGERARRSDSPAATTAAEAPPLHPAPYRYYCVVDSAVKQLVIRDALDLANRLEAESAKCSGDPLERLERLQRIADSDRQSIYSRAVAALMERTPDPNAKLMSSRERHARQDQRDCGYPEVGLERLTAPPPGVSVAEHYAKIEERLAMERAGVTKGV